MGADVTIGAIRLINGDMRAVLPTLTERAAMVMSDPPYALTSGGGKSVMNGALSAQRYDNKGALFDLVPWSEMAPLFFDVLRPDADAVVMSSDRELQAARGAFELAGFRFHRLLVWDKVSATPNRWFMPNCEFALYLWKGNARTISHPKSKQLIKCPQRDVAQDYCALGEGHPTEKPVALMQHWIENCTEPGDLVLDPFCGSGSTLVAAALAGRRAIGVELDPRYFEIACRRVEEIAAALDHEITLNAPLSAVQRGLEL